MTLLELSVREGHFDLVKYLVDHGAEVNTQDDENGEYRLGIKYINIQFLFVIILKPHKCIFINVCNFLLSIWTC